MMRGSGSEGQEPLTVSVKKLKYLGSTTRAMNEIKVEAMCRLNGGKGRWEAWAVYGGVEVYILLPKLEHWRALEAPSVLYGFES